MERDIDAILEDIRGKFSDVMSPHGIEVVKHVGTVDVDAAIGQSFCQPVVVLTITDVDGDISGVSNLEFVALVICSDHIGLRSDELASRLADDVASIVRLMKVEDVSYARRIRLAPEIGFQPETDNGFAMWSVTWTGQRLRRLVGTLDEASLLIQNTMEVANQLNLTDPPPPEEIERIEHYLQADDDLSVPPTESQSEI